MEKKKKMNDITKIVIAMLLGSVVGIIVGKPAAAIGFVGDIWLNLMKMFLVPIVVCMLVKGISSIVVAEDNYGEGSSREHAAMEPRFLNVKVILAKSFARIHETNLKKQGMLALTFCNKDDYNKVQEDDRISLTGLKEFAPGSKLTVTLKHKDGSEDSFEVEHTYNDTQIAWFKAGSALNFAAKK